MMVERHYDDEALISFVGSDGEARRDPHLATCTSCAESLHSYRAMVDVLGQDAIWDLRDMRSEPVPSTVAFLRAFADDMTREDSAADIIVAELLSGARTEWMPKLRRHPEFRTAGVVRKLIESTDRALDTMPPDAVEITTLAIDIADNLEPSAYASDTVLKLRAAAWRERAYALYFVGSLSDALQAATRARSIVEPTTVSEYEIARIDLLRAVVLRASEQLGPALSLTRDAFSGLDRFGDDRRARDAHSIEAAVQYRLGSHREALAIWTALETEAADDAVALARILPNIGACYKQLGQLDLSLRYLQLAAAVLEDLNVPAEAVRVRWNVAAVLLKAGRPDDAVRQMKQVRDDFSALGMQLEAALVGLEASEVLLMEGRVVEVDELCRHALGVFRDAAIAYGDSARTAIAYLQEAAQQGRATPALVQHVHQYVRRLPDNPRMLFAPPPL